MMLSRWAISLFGTALLAGVLWWFGPLWPPLEPPLPRIVGIQALVLLWIIGNVALDGRQRRRSAALTAGMSPAGEERDAVGQSFERALSLLGKQRRAALIDLPWYAIIGPPGAGKTTALLNAGLTFPLAAELGRAPVPGVGGTRLCDWWFTNRAVLIDTAGRYTTQDSDAAVDRAGWTAFLALLKRTRPAQPLNGVIVAIGVPDVVQASAAERDAHAAAIARRLAELEQSFGTRLPVYGLFTKADLVAGFTEFFDDLDADGRDQAWGETFPLAAAKPATERFAETFRSLAQRVATRMTGRLAGEARADRRPLIAGFPTQLASVTPSLAGFASAAFGQGMVRGVYLASGTQEGTPIDRLAGTMSRAFGLPATRVAGMQSGQGRSYFLGRLLRDVIFGEAMLVRRNPALARRRFVLRAAGFTIVLLLLAAASGAILWSAQRGEAQLGPVADALASYTRDAGTISADTVSDGDLRALVPLLDRARALATGLPPGTIPLGMDQSAKLEAGAQIVYRNGLIYGLLPRLLWRLEAEMRGALPEPERLYELLRVYLMLGSAGPIDPAAVRAWFTRDAELPPQALPHLNQLLADLLPPVSLDAPLIQAARASIERVPPATRIYANIRSSAAAAALPPWRPADSLGLAGVGLFSRASGASLSDGIPGLFTTTGFRTVLLAALPAASRQVGAESWVVGRTTEAAPVAEVERGVQALYWAEFTKRWDALLADLEIAPIATLPQASQALYILASPESPMRALLRSMANALRPPPDADPAVTAQLARYAPLVGLTSGDGAALERSLRLVADIQQPFAKIAALPVGTPLPPGGEDIGAALQVDAARQPPPLSRWLSTIAATSTALRTGDARRQLALLYNAPGGPAQACAAAITHYPFAANGTPLPEDEFTRLFGPAGTLDGFLNTQLKAYVDTSSEPWKTRPPITLAAADLAQFQRAAAIRAAFFPGGNSASFPIEVAPTGLATPATLTLGSVAISSGKGVAHAAIVTWPPATPEAALTTDLPGLTFRETGFWALQRLAARGRIRPEGKPGGYVLTFGAPPAAVAYTLRSPALAPGLLSDFRCPAVP